MTLPPLPNPVQRILNITLLFSLLGAFSIFMMGHSVLTINEEVKGLKNFIEISKDVQPNFEQSLVAYTQETQHLIAFLLALRPDSEAEVITFISTVEGIGQALHVDLNLESVDADEESEENTLSYQIGFYGTYEQLNDFLTALEELPYFIRVRELEFQTFDAGNAQKTQNIHLTLDLYVQ